MQINLRALSLALVLSGLISTPAFAATDGTTDVLLRGAKKWIEKDRSDLAKNLLVKVILIDPASTDALFMLGSIELKNGKPDEAKRYLRTLEQTAPGDKRTHDLNDAINDREPKRISLTPLVTDEESKPPAKHKVVAAAAPVEKLKTKAETTEALHPQSRKSKQGHEDLQRNADKEATSLANDPDIIARTDALDAMADGNLDLAETSLLDILKRRPQDPEVIGGLGLVKQAQGKFDESEKWFSQALLAAQAKKVVTERWTYLISMSKFSQYMTNAKTLLDENKLPEAEAAVQQARTLKPEDPDAIALLGNIRAAGNDFVEAERLYREALKTEGYNIFAARGLASLLARTGRSEEAIEFIEQTLHQYQDEWRKNPYSEASLLRAEAELHIEAHRSSRAMKVLEKAVNIDPKNPWVRFSLAKLYISIDLAPLARRVVQEGIELAPADPAMHQVSALVLLSLEDYAAGIDSLNQIPEESLTQEMRNTKDQALIKYALQQAENKLAQGKRKEAIRILSVAETQAQNNYVATEQVAEAWFRLGQQKQGLTAMRKLPQPVPLGTQVHFASLLNRAKKDQELTDYLPSLRIPVGADDASKKYRKTIQDIEFSMAGRQYDKLLKSGKKDEAQEFADNILNANQLSSSDYFKYHRSYFTNAKFPEGAIFLLNQEKEQNPNDLDIRCELAYAYHQEKQNSNAQREIHELLALTKSDDIDMLLRVAKLQQDVGDTTGARVAIDDLTRRFPNNTEVLFKAGDIARSDGKYNRAMVYYQQSKERAHKSKPIDSSTNIAEQPSDILLNLLPSLPMESKATNKISIAPPLVNTKESDKIYRSALASDVGQEKHVAGSEASYAEQAMINISERRSVKLEAGLDIQSKTASNGTSTYNATEIPLLVRFPIGYEAHGTVQVDKVDIDAGALPSNFADAALFGKIQAFQYVPAQPLTPNASGTSISLGYEQESTKADIGKVGIGFPISNVVGGVRNSGSIGRMSYSLNLSRRPYTGSLLSYAGAKDPVTGTLWGGVTNTGASLYLSTSISTALLGNFNIAAITSYGLLRGTNVQNNDRLFLQASIDKDLYASNDTVLNLGLNLKYTSFSSNQAFYTFGHGGYYSPQSSLSIGLPIELIGREDLLSYQIKTNITYSRTNEDAALYYPTDPALQVLAAANPFYSSIYKGGAGGGFGYGLLAATEYRLTPDFVLGGRFNVDRSAYYAPNSAFFYMRYMFKPETGPVSMRPDPVVPYSQY